MNSRSSRCVLCIGSDPVNLNLRCALLKDEGWEVISSSSGYEAIFRFAKGGIDLIVLDLNGNGVESALIAGEFKRQSPRVPIIMLVANKDVLVPSATDQADAVVLKSEEELVLPECIRRLLGPT